MSIMGRQIKKNGLLCSKQAKNRGFYIIHVSLHLEGRIIT
jgi:hypothetical protein